MTEHTFLSPRSIYVSPPVTTPRRRCKPACISVLVGGRHIDTDLSSDMEKIACMGFNDNAIF